MATAIRWKQRLLFAIIRAPTLSQKRQPHNLTAPVRSLHTTHSPRSDGFSITFGPQIDSLLNTGNKKKVKGRLSARSGTRKSSVGQSYRNKPGVDDSESKNNTFSAQSVRRNEFLKPQTNFDPRSTQDEMHAYSLRINDIDRPTLELSDGAFETISESRHSDSYSSDNQPKELANTIDGAEGNDLNQEIKREVKLSTIHSARGCGTTTGRTVLSASLTAHQPRKKMEQWQIQKDALQKKFGEEGWSPRKRLSPDAMDGIRALHEGEPDRYTTEILSQQFKVSPEAIRRILRSKWRPSPEEMEERRERWARRHDRIWDQKAALGLRPPRRRDREPEGPEAFEEEVRAKQMLGQL